MNFSYEKWLLSVTTFLNKNSKRQNSSLELTGFAVYCRFEFICFFANKYREAFLLLRVFNKSCLSVLDTKNSKRQNFSLELTSVLNRWTNNSQSLRFICFFANIIEKCFLMRSRYKKFKEAEFFTRTDKFCCWSSRYKKFKEAKFLTNRHKLCES